MSTVADDIIASMRDNPGNWQEAAYYLTHRSGVSVWISNGFWFYRPHRSASICSEAASFSFVEKVRFALALRKWRRIGGEVLQQALRDHDHGGRP